MFHVSQMLIIWNSEVGKKTIPGRHPALRCTRMFSYFYVCALPVVKGDPNFAMESFSFYYNNFFFLCPFIYYFSFIFPPFLSIKAYIIYLFSRFEDSAFGERRRWIEKIWKKNVYFFEKCYKEGGRTEMA